MRVPWSVSAQDSESRRVTLVPHSPLAICLATGEKRAMNRRHKQKETRANSASPGDDPSIHPCQNHFVSIVGYANGSLSTGETTDVLLIGTTTASGQNLQHPSQRFAGQCQRRGGESGVTVWRRFRFPVPGLRRSSSTCLSRWRTFDEQRPARER